MLIELHMIQNFAPSCLNRDDTNAPKDCEFGGYRRARISSQCIKRAVRKAFKSQGLLPDDMLAVRSKRVPEELTKRLVASGKPESEAQLAVAAAFGSLGLKADDRTEYLLFLGQREIDGLAALVDEHWDELVGVGSADESAVEGDTSSKKRKKGASAVSETTKKAFVAALDGGNAADLALFGRMLANLPGKNVNAACQVAHALSTNRVSMEMDYFTAVDDLKAEDESGADMIGTVEFNSACFYRYANVDLGQLSTNLNHNEEHARAVVRAFISAAISAIPTGRQNSMAAQNPPSLVLAIVRDGAQPWSLANAFVQPVRPDASGGLVRRSVEALDDYWARLASMYGDSDVRARPVCVLDEAELPNLGKQRVDSVQELTCAVMEAIES